MPRWFSAKRATAITVRSASLLHTVAHVLYDGSKAKKLDDVRCTAAPVSCLFQNTETKNLGEVVVQPTLPAMRKRVLRSVLDSSWWSALRGCA